ncbi:hypothetical protein MKX03_011430 [Papaver bracteatum]|nr:hypothetical protein MKX03_011430 [Papaver bracteatum]
MSRFLPVDIIENIVTRLPVRSISRFRCVSKNWYHLFRNPNFIKNHLNHANLMNRFNILVCNYGGDIDDTPIESYLSTIDNDLLSSSPSTSSQYLGHARNIDYPFMSLENMPMIIGSSNGLVCIQPCSDDIWIWNLATGEYKPVPKPSDSEHYYTFYGFGFDCKNDDYKVLRIVGCQESEVSEARLYSLASNSWKELGVVPYNFSKIVTRGLLLNGVLHWVATVHRNGCKSSVTVCFNVSDETFHDVPLSNNISMGDRFLSDLGIWDGKLCLVRINHMEDPYICQHHNDHVDVWTMMDNKWSKHLVITAQITDMHYGRPVQTLQNGEILFEGGPMEEVHTGLMAYDPTLERARALRIHGFPEVAGVDTYIDTLVALNSGTYVE